MAEPKPPLSRLLHQLDVLNNHTLPLCCPASAIDMHPGEALNAPVAAIVEFSCGHADFLLQVGLDLGA